MCTITYYINSPLQVVNNDIECSIYVIRAKKEPKMYARRKKLPVILESEEVHQILSIPNTRYLTSLRSKAMISLMVNCGLRVSEVINLKPGDINLLKGRLRVIDGKNGVDRDIHIPENTATLLREWKQRKPASDYFFSTVRDNKAGGTYTKKHKGKTWTIDYSSKKGDK